MATYNQVSDGRPDGAMVGQNSSDKVGFYGTTPVVQPSSASQAAVTATITTTAVLTQVATQASANTTLLNQIRSELVTLGLLKGSA